MQHKIFYIKSPAKGFIGDIKTKKSNKGIKDDKLIFHLSKFLSRKL